MLRKLCLEEEEATVTESLDKVARLLNLRQIDMTLPPPPPSSPLMPPPPPPTASRGMLLGEEGPGMAEAAAASAAMMAVVGQRGKERLSLLFSRPRSETVRSKHIFSFFLLFFVLGREAESI